MTPAQHAEGRQFDPGQVYERRRGVVLYLLGAGGGLWKWCSVCSNVAHNHGGSAWQKYGCWWRGAPSVLACFSPWWWAGGGCCCMMAMHTMAKYRVAAPPPGQLLC